MARLELAKTWHRQRCHRGLRWLWHQDPNAEPFPALSRKGDMPRSFLVPLGARMPDSSVPPSEWAAPGTAQSRAGPRHATADRVDRADAHRLAGQEDHRTGLFRHTGADRAGLHLGTQPGQPRTRPQRYRPTVTFLFRPRAPAPRRVPGSTQARDGLRGRPLLRRTHTKADQSKASTPASIHP
jgi:hypothetical protein